MYTAYTRPFPVISHHAPCTYSLHVYIYTAGIALHMEAGNEREREIITPDLFTNYSKTTLQKTK